ncbi:Protein of unknown function [Pyronema omphalodes CBS 100304]|uniref:Uncharacterized protein n=1 Tax=Pyronema omphalodes (strain CBS 100304) TaxID=1076935 RepID=U4LJ35_PYROM|nr:Protein of unknown function [Pyronema omphalodes CBS 100304]
MQSPLDLAADLCFSGEASSCKHGAMRSSVQTKETKERLVEPVGRRNRRMRYRNPADDSQDELQLRRIGAAVQSLTAATSVSVKDSI